MGIVQSKFAQRGWQFSALATAFLIASVYKAQKQGNVNVKKGQPKKDDEKVHVNLQFFSRFLRIARVMVPGVVSQEFGYMLLLAGVMVARTYCDMWMIKNGTAIERAIISRDLKSFLDYVGRFMSVMLPISIVNNLIKFTLSKLSLRFRIRLTEHLTKNYLRGFTYYKLSNLDNRINNPDQLLTQDVEKFCLCVTELYSNISKPILDIIIYAIKLTGAIGGQGPSAMLLYLAISGFMITVLRKPISRYTVVEQQLEGEFRHVLSRLKTNSEEIAFYNGNQKEKAVVEGAFSKLVGHLNKAMEFRFSMGVLDNIVAKYWATVVGYAVVSRPFLDLAHPRHKNSTHGEIMEDYYRSGRMLVNLATAVGRLVLAGRELTRLAGFTSRVTQFMNVLDDLNAGQYQRTMVTAENAHTQTAASLGLIRNSGHVTEADNIIKFESVPIVTPNGDVLVKSLNLEVKSGTNVLVAGPNGCGKSSMFRILGGLWPLWGGTLVKPSAGKMFYVPQRPYMTLGTLRDQVIYPHSKEDVAAKGLTDYDLLQFLKQVHLEYLVDREGGWDSQQDWMDVLSGGEKQRIAMARLFYHQPQFAILDECTSAVSVDWEGFMYTHCKTLGITLFTVSHRKTLWKYHDFVLQFDGNGKYEFLPIMQQSADV